TADFVGILDALRSLEHFPVTVVALSLGSSGSILRVGSEVIRAYAPDIQVVNTIGCGDAYLAGL
ncbi:MAG TPA: 1-phosphofructokinase, partial [Firmicutes bacterium]|nr:1-phosphofructokinase [Bacillota bacterium]